jgi:hypothetical protein
MSHTTEINNIVFADIEALKAAVNELNSKGIKCTLVKGGTPRAYYQNQQGMGAADYTLQLDGSPYDIGFYTDKEKKGLVARTDLFMGHVARVLGAQASAGESQAQAALGQLYQTYAIHAATRKAVQQGMSVKRVNNADGSVRLVVGGIR